MKAVAVSFNIVFGINPGYTHENALPENTTAAQIVARVWREELEVEFNATNILVGGVVTDGRVVYPASFGCPVDGEVSAVVSGNSNPKFVHPEDISEFKNAVIAVAKAVKARLAQSRVQIAFAEVHDFVYLEPEDSGGDQRWE